MGLFDKFTKSGEDFPKNEAEAWMGIFYACISADGEVEDSEIDALVELIGKKEQFARIDDLVPLYRRASKAESSIGNIELIKACCPLIEEEYKSTVFSMAVDLVATDGDIAIEEEKLIYILKDELEIDSDLASRIVEVIGIRNKGNIN
jgi:uncharacterized tellurite resistance protein B-like protein